jgi:hypothetical protein
MGIRKDELLASTQLKNFSIDIDNKISVESVDRSIWRNYEEINYINKLQEILNDIKKKNKVENNLDGAYEEVLEELEELFIVKKHEEESVQLLDSCKTQLSDYENEVNFIERRFDQSIDDIIYNRSNIHGRVQSLENLVAISNAPSIMHDMMEDIRYGAFDDNNGFTIHHVNTLINKNSEQQWNYLYTFDAQNIANKYGINLSDKISTQFGFLAINKMREISDEARVLLMSYYWNREELRLLKNYIVPEIDNDVKKYEKIIDKRNESKGEIERLGLEIEEFRKFEKIAISSLKKKINFQEDTFDKLKLEMLITDINLSSIKREVTRIFKYRTLKRSENEVLEITRGLINMYEDILDASYEVIINQSEEFYVVMSDSVINTLKFLRRRYTSAIMSDRIEELLSYGDYIDKAILDNFIVYLKRCISQREESRLHPDIRNEIRWLIDQLSKAELKKKEDSNFSRNIFEVKNAYEHINFILEDYIKLSTLLEIIKVESNSASKKLREEVINLIVSNVVSETNKFSSFKRFIESLQQ